MNHALRFRWALAVLVCLSLGCASTITVEANGSRNTDQPIPPDVTYAVFRTGEVDKDQTFPDYARLVSRELTKRDYKETEGKVAKLGVYLAYAITAQSVAPQSTSAGPPMGSTGGSGGGSGYGGGSGTGYGTAVSTPSSPVRPSYVSQVVVVVADLAQSRAAGSIVELWRGEAKTTGTTHDLPAVAPALVEAAFRHFGQATPSPVRHAFSEEDVKTIQQAK